MPFGRNKTETQRRFTTLYQDSRQDVEGIKIIKDNVTGVNYLILKEMAEIQTSSSITPLIGSDGKIVIDPVVDTDEISIKNAFPVPSA